MGAPAAPELWRARQPAARGYAAVMAEHIGTSWGAWRAAHGEPLVIEGTLVVWTDGSVTIDVGDGTLRPLGGLIADYFERRPDALGDRFVGHVDLRVKLLATPVPPPGWDEPAGGITSEWQRVRNL